MARQFKESVNECSDFLTPLVSVELRDRETYTTGRSDHTLVRGLEAS